MNKGKAESGESSASSIENVIVQLAKDKPNGISNEHIKNAIPDTPLEIWTKIINKLLKSGYVIFLLNFE